MEKECVLDYLGGTTATAKFLGIAKSTVSVWPTQIPWKYALLLERLTLKARRLVWLKSF
ncbi:hypothetical protein VQZ80_004504 [Salmonella enterica]|nr:hypothetical protein [Salmonella enterica]EKC2309019.1 hypothetical protein [Salmonella enterica]EKC2388510.1 hypothetical protein [Salmonella enterica]EKC2531996.1 hypothetical protein [Salmonella enterica]EKC2987195.1 hypothetical protein [Salmonella enterica]